MKKRGVLQRLFIDFPRIKVHDIYTRDKQQFEEKGLHLVVGEQGAGKTITVVHLLHELKKQYPKMKIRTNMNYKHQDGAIKGWKDLVFKNNGIYGQVDVIDEIQNWFNSLESKNFPPEMFSEISQQRKQRKMILGTSQVWGRVAKPIREQVSYVYKPCTIFGCITIVRKYKPSVDDEGGIDKLKLRKLYFFVHSCDIRDSFDTYHKIQTMSLKGFKPYSEQMSFTGGIPIDVGQGDTQ